MNMQGLLGMAGMPQMTQQSGPRGMSGGLLGSYGGQGGMSAMVDPMSYYGGQGGGMPQQFYGSFTPAAQMGGQEQGGGRYIPPNPQGQAPQQGAGQMNMQQMIQMLTAANPYSFNPQEFQFRYENPGMPTNGRFGE